MRVYGKLAALILMLGFSGAVALSAEKTSPMDVVAAFNQALIGGDSEALQRTLATHVSMFNGAESDDISKWQPHMYLSDSDVKEWADFMVSSAGPHENSYEFVTVEERANMALVVTRETEETSSSHGRRANACICLAILERNGGSSGFFCRMRVTRSREGI